MTTLQLHVEPIAAGESYHVVRVWRLNDAGERDAIGVKPPAYHGQLYLPSWLVQRAQQLTPLVEQMIGECHIAWTGVALPALPADPMLGKLGKVLRGMRRVVFGSAP